MHQYLVYCSGWNLLIVGAQLERVKLGGGVCLPGWGLSDPSALVDGLTSQNTMPVDGEELP